MARSLRMRNQVTVADSVSPETTAVSDRPRRTTSAQHKSYQETDEDEEEDTITVEQVTSKPPAGSIKLKLKMPPSRLRESTLGKATPVTPVENTEVMETPSSSRASRARRQVIMESESDDDEDADGQNEDDDDLDDEDLEGEEEDDAGDGSDFDMDVAPPPPIIRKTGTASKPTITITSAPKAGKIKSVEAKEISMATGEDFDDDDLSDLSDDDAEGDIVEDDALEDDADGDSFDEDDMSGAGTPDLSKMTKRQRALVDISGDDHFMALNMGPQTKLHLTDEQRNLRRVEMARRRKNLSEKRNEEEKQDTINRLLKKQAPKRRGKISAAEIAAGGETPDIPMDDIDQVVIKADPVFTRWTSGPRGVKLSIPIEWKDKFVAVNLGSNGWKMVEEVE